MPLYNMDDFDKSVIPNHFKTEVREIMEIAVMLGWKLHVTGAQSCTIIAPDERKKYHFGRRNSTPLNRIRKDLVKYGDPEKVAALTAVGEKVVSGPARETAVDFLTTVDGDQIVDSRPEKEEVEVPEPRKPESSQSEPTIISVKPMLARAKAGKAYESKTTFERKWSDGSTDYTCQFKGCEETSANRLSISRHYANQHSKGVAPRPPEFNADVPGATPYAPRQTRIDALTAVIEGLLAENGELTPEELARASLMWVHEQSKRGSEHAEEREPMTAEDTLHRIKTLLDDGSRLAERKQMEALEQRLIEAERKAEETGWQAEQAAAAVAAAEKRASEAEARAEATRASLRALGDLLSEVTAEQAG